MRFASDAAVGPKTLKTSGPSGQSRVHGVPEVVQGPSKRLHIELRFASGVLQHH